MGLPPRDGYGGAPGQQGGPPPPAGGYGTSGPPGGGYGQPGQPSGGYGQPQDSAEAARRAYAEQQARQEYERQQYGDATAADRAARGQAQDNYGQQILDQAAGGSRRAVRKGLSTGVKALIAGGVLAAGALVTVVVVTGDEDPPGGGPAGSTVAVEGEGEWKKLTLPASAYNADTGIDFDEGTVLVEKVDANNSRIGDVDVGLLGDLEYSNSNQLSAVPHSDPTEPGKTYDPEESTMGKYSLSNDPGGDPVEACEQSALQKASFNSDDLKEIVGREICLITGRGALVKFTFKRGRDESLLISYQMLKQPTKESIVSK